MVEPYPSEQYDFVSWDDDIPNMMGKIKVMFQTTNQPTSNHPLYIHRIYIYPIYPHSYQFSLNNTMWGPQDI